MVNKSEMQWHAEWIWYEPASKENSFLLGRRPFRLDSVPPECPVTLSADTAYKLFVNGTLVCRGPVRSGGRYRYYDQIDISPFLVPGENVLAVLVHHYGFTNFRYLKSRAGFILQGKVGEGISLNTGSSGWKVMEGEAWASPLARSSLCLAFPEVVDMRKIPEGWNRTGFDDSTWKVPYVIGRPPCEPWTDMLPRDIPFLTEHFAELKPDILAIRTADAYPEVRTIEFGLTLSDDLNPMCAYLVVCLRAKSDLPFLFNFAADGQTTFFLDGCPILPNPPSQDNPRHKWINPVSMNLTRGLHHVMVKVFKESFKWTFSYAIPDSEGIEFSCDGIHYYPQCDRWQVVGPFDGPGRHPPEDTIDLSQRYPGIQGEVAWQPVTARYNVSRQVTCELPTTDLGIPKQFPIRIPPSPSGTCATITIDLGREITGFPYLEVQSEEDGAVLDLAYSEFLQENRVIPSQWAYDFADRVILKKGRQIYESAFWWKGFRYLQLTARNTAGAVTVNAVKVRQHHYPVTEQGSFECSDPLLNRIWRTGAYTLLCCMNDAYMDCPSREQSLYIGDLLVELLANFYTFGDQKLAENAFNQFSRYQYPTGFFPAVCPGQTEKMDDLFVDQCFAWVGNLWNFYLYTGDSKILDTFFPTIEKLLGGIEKYQNADGLFQGIRDRVFVDHAVWQAAHQDDQRINAGLNLVIYYTLLDAVQIARAIRRPEHAARYADQAEKLKQGFHRKMWSPDQRVYTEGWSEGKQIPTVSVHTNCLAILYDIAPKENQEAIVDYIFNEANPVIRNYSPFFAYFIHRMFFKLGRPGRVLELIRTQWGKFLDQGFTTWPETFTGLYDSNCHAYSCTPNIDLARDILGVRPTEPGFTRFEVNPALDLLEWASGNVPTPYGTIKFSSRKKKNIWILTLQVPDKTVGEVTLPAFARCRKWTANGTDRPVHDHIEDQTPEAILCTAGDHYFEIKGS